MPEPLSELKFNSIEELNKEACTIVDVLKKNNSVVRLLKSIEKCTKEGKNEDTAGNLEMAYILYSRSFYIMDRIKELKEYKADEFYYQMKMKDLLVDPIKRLECLQPILERRYEEKKQHTSSKINVAELRVRVDDVEPSAPSTPVNNGVKLPLGYEEREFISCRELKNMIWTRKAGENTTLIIDVRSSNDFKKSRMNLEDVINIPVQELTSNLTPSIILKQHLDDKFKPFFERRMEYDWVIVVDWFSSEDTRNTNFPVGKMMSTLTKWDCNTRYRRRPVVLEGGFEDWLACYPLNTTNPAVSPPRVPTNDSSFIIDDIVFPSARDLEPAFVADSSTNVIRQPVIDRSTKPTFHDEKTEFANNGNDVSINKILADDNGAFLRKISNGCIIESSKDDEVRAPNGPPPSDSDLDLDADSGKLYSQRGRRSALANTTDQMIYRDPTKSNGEDEVLDNDDAAVHRDEDENESRFEGGRVGVTENTSNMKRSSSTPNILKLNINEGNRPLVDRSTKPPSHDDQLNSFTMHDNYSSNEIGKGLMGLKNLGNTCYMNSIIQCLSNTEPLKKKLLSSDTPPKINNQSKTRGLVAKALRAILTQLWSGEGGSVSCKELKTIVGEHRDTFRGYEQQDSHEFLTILIDWLHEDLKQTPQSGILDGADENSGEKAWGEFTSKNNSIVRTLFYGQLKSTVCCSVCSKESITFEPFSNLSLPLPTEEKCSLTDCLRLYTKDESILGWQCPGCNASRKATKKLDITKLPPLLVIHLKRFTSDGWCRKRLTNVEFPNVLNMSSFVTGDEHRFRRYRLYAVSNHYGTMESGHYTAYCLNAPNKSWYKFDDQEVTSLGDSVPKLSAAYIVFYQYLTN